MCLAKTNRLQRYQGYEVGLKELKEGPKTWTQTWTQAWTQSRALMMAKSVLGLSKSLAGAAPPLS